MDYGSRVEANSNGVNSKNSNKQSKEEMVKSLARMNDFIKKFLERAPPYYFLSVFPQLTSRICHAHADVWAILRTILIKTFLSYPHHVFWHMVALSKSSYPQRAKRCKEIFDHVRSKLKTKLIDDGDIVSIFVAAATRLVGVDSVESKFQSMEHRTRTKSMRYFGNIKLSHVDKTDKLNSFLSREGSIWPPSSFILNLDNDLQNIFSP